MDRTYSRLSALVRWFRGAEDNENRLGPFVPRKEKGRPHLREDGPFPSDAQDPYSAGAGIAARWVCPCCTSGRLPDRARSMT